jgi:hypothetical protein
LILQTGREYIGWFLAVSPYVVIKWGMISYTSIKACIHIHTHTCAIRRKQFLSVLSVAAVWFFIKMFSTTVCCRKNSGMCVMRINSCLTGVFRKDAHCHSSCIGHLNSHIKNWCTPENQIVNGNSRAFTFRLLQKISGLMKHKASGQFRISHKEFMTYMSPPTAITRVSQ